MGKYDRNELLTSLVLRLTAYDLPRRGLRKSYPDTYAVVTSITGPHHSTGALDGEEHVIGRTEIIPRCCRPQWITTIPFMYELGSDCYFRVRLFRVCQSCEDKAENLGSGVFEVGDILGSMHRTKIRRLPKGGVILCRLEPNNSIHQDRAFRFRFTAKLDVERSRLRPLPRFSTAPDTIVEISKQHPSSKGWVPIYRSSPVENSWMPKWDEGLLDLDSLCNGDKNQPLRIAVLQHRKKDQNQVLAECETTLPMILQTQLDTHSTRSTHEASTVGFPLYDTTSRQKVVGRLQVPLAEEHRFSDQGKTYERFPCCYAVVGDDNSYHDPSIITVAAFPIPMAAPNTSFEDYIHNQGWRLELNVAIDFTSSNGDPRIPGTLHDMNSTTLNDYEETIVSIATALAPYTVGKSLGTTVWGFGCKFDNVVRHIFQCGSEPRVYGVGGILQAYKSVFDGDLIMSGPTCFDQVIQAAAVRARKYQQTQQRLYSVLLIITDGICQNLQETQRKLHTYSICPLTTIIVGVGRADFTEMHRLDSLSKVVTCEFRQHQHDPHSMGNYALEALKAQFVEYCISTIR